MKVIIYPSIGGLGVFNCIKQEKQSYIVDEEFSIGAFRHMDRKDLFLKHTAIGQFVGALHALPLYGIAHVHGIDVFPEKEYGNWNMSNHHHYEVKFSTFPGNHVNFTSLKKVNVELMHFVEGFTFGSVVEHGDPMRSNDLETVDVFKKLIVKKLKDSFVALKEERVVTRKLLGRLKSQQKLHERMYQVKKKK